MKLSKENKGQKLLLSNEKFIRIEIKTNIQSTMGINTLFDMIFSI